MPLEVGDAEGLSKTKAAVVVDAAIDRWVWYAGWTDKIAQVVGGGNPVAGPYFNLSSPEPPGVVAVLAPQESSFMGLVRVVAPVPVLGLLGPDDRLAVVGRAFQEAQ